MDYFAVGGSERWVGPAIQNARKYTDRLFVNVGYHHPGLEPVGDRTAERASAEANRHDDVVLFDYPSNTDPSIPPDHWKCRILNAMLSEANPKVGDTVAICDSDEFYTDKGLECIEDFKDSDCELGCVRSYNFCINFNWYIVNPDMMRFFKVTSPDFHFVPTQKPVPKPESEMILKAPMFHYSFLLNPEMKLRYWSHSPIGNKAKQEMKKRWLREVYLKWDLCNPEPYIRKNKELFGPDCGKFWFQNGMEEGERGLFEFDAPQPIEEVKHLEDIEDFRRIYD